MGAVKEASWSTQSGVMECGYHDRQGNGNCRCPTRRKVDIACVQEVKWKGSKARNMAHGYKLFYHGDTSNRNGVGIILQEERTKDILEISRAE